MKNTKRKSIRSKILTLIAIPMAAVCVVVFVACAILATTLVDGAMSETLISAQNTMDFLIDDAANKAQSTSMILGNSKNAFQSIESSIKELFPDSNPFDIMVQTDSNGTVTSSNINEISIGSKLNDDALVKKALAGNSSSGTGSLGEIPLAVYAASPVIDNQETILLGTNIATNSFAAIAKNLTSTEVAFTVDGNFIANSNTNNEYNLIGSPLSKKMMDPVLKNGEAIKDDTSKINGQEYRANAVPIKDMNGKIIGCYWVGLPAHNQVIIYLAVVALVGLVFTVALYLGSKRADLMIKPIQALEHAALEIAKGDVNQSIACQGNDEIFALEEAFNKMSENMIKQVQLVEEVAQGNLTLSVDVRSEKDKLNQQLKIMIDSNKEIIGEIKNTARGVSAGSEQIAQAAQVLAEGSTQQAAAVEEVNSTTTNIGAQSKENASYSKEAYELIKDIELTLDSSMNEMRETVRAMQEISAAAQSISNINKVIDDIAFQTNILALNAAVEAARAGQHGKGFAVVADEVRNLATKSAQASQETKDLIDNSLEKTQIGSKLVQATNNSLQEISVSSSKAVELVESIAQASNDQAENVQQVNISLEQVSDVTQHNAATAQESASASQELADMSATLTNLVERYKLD